MARPKKTVAVATAPVMHGHTVEAGENGKWLARLNGKPVRVFANEAEAKKYVDYVRDRVK